MTTNLLSQFSDALAARAAAVQGAIAAVRLAHGRHLSATLWQPDVAIASEQSLPRRDEFELVLAGGAVARARLVGSWDLFRKFSSWPIFAICPGSVVREVPGGD